MRKSLFAAALFSICALLSAFDSKNTIVPVKIKNSDIQEAWRNAVVHGDFHKFKSAEKSVFKSQIRICYDDEALYVRLTGFDPDFFYREEIKGYSDKNSVELFIVPDTASKNNYFHTIGTLSGKILHSRFGNSETDRSSYSFRIIPSNQDYFTAEWKIPFRVFSKMPRKGEIWKISVARGAENRKMKENSSLTELKRPTFHDVDNFARLSFPENVSSRLLAAQIAEQRKKHIRGLLKKSAMEMNFLKSREKDFEKFGMLATWKKLSSDFALASDSGTSDYMKRKLLSGFYEHLLVFRYQYDLAKLTMEGK